MPHRLSIQYACAALLAAVCLGVSSPAMAGFQWVAPSDAVSAPPMGVSQPMPLSPAPVAAPSSFYAGPATSAPEIISPVVITGDSAPVAPAPAVVARAPAAVDMSMASNSAPEPLLPQPAAPAAPLAAAPPAQVPVVGMPSDNAVVHGFAKSMPLAVALREILPAGYSFSIDEDVDMGTLVSFRGGRPWRDTLRDALAPVGLVAHDRGQMVVVGYPARGVQAASGSAPASATAVNAPLALTPPSMPEVGGTHEGVMAASSATATLPAPLPAPALREATPGSASGTLYAPGMEPKAWADPMAPQPLAPLPTSISMPAPIDAMPSVATETWTAERGAALRKVLEEWCRRSHVEFEWLSEYDYPLQASVSFTGNFESAVRGLLTGFQSAHPQPVAELHANANLGQMVLVVQTRGNTNSD